MRSRTPTTTAGTSLFSKLSAFSSLASLCIGPHIVITSTTLSKLPKSLVELRLKRVELENYGLPFGKEVDWKDGALSRLPETLERLDLDFLYAPPESIDFKVFSMLPSRLETLKVNTRHSVCLFPKSFIASLPKRLTTLEYLYSDPPDEDDEFLLEGRDIKEELREAIAEYYSDPFWIGKSTVC